MNLLSFIITGASALLLSTQTSLAKGSHDIVEQSAQKRIRKLQIQSALKEFQARPNEFMQKLPPKFNTKGQRVTETPRFFDSPTVSSNDYVTKKDSQRIILPVFYDGEITSFEDYLKQKSLEFQADPGRAEIEENDQAENIAELDRSEFLSNLEEIDRRNLKEASLSKERWPWSDDYWAIYKGQLATRYAESGYSPNDDWKENHKHYKDSTLTIEDIVNRPNASSLDFLSPAEKYDLLVGDPNQSFTNYMWNQGQYYYENNDGKVETWMGICHGWAAAAYKLPRPKKKITVLAANGINKINFYPADVKALSSQLWAVARTGALFLGGRCNEKNPQKDSTNGRVFSQDCFDNNPGTFFKALINRIGVPTPDQKLSFVMDATYDYEVWNQPVVGYKYSYFNPQTGNPVNTLAEAIVEKSKFTNDKFKNNPKFRSQKRAYVVGIALDVTYVIETKPQARATDGPEQDAHRTVRYLFDLELDAKKNIIGGEWYQNAHPDFLWTPSKQTHAYTDSDRSLSGSWDGKKALPENWRKSAIKEARGGKPLAKILNALIASSQF